VQVLALVAGEAVRVQALVLVVLALVAGVGVTAVGGRALPPPLVVRHCRVNK
jgi:hypothetical protein